MAASRVVVNEARLREWLTEGENAPVTRAVAKATEQVLQEAKRLCPVSPSGHEEGGVHYGSGHLRSSLTGSLTGNGGSLTGRVLTEVPYAPFVEFGTKPHVIESHGDYPLRNRRTGEVFGRVVHHPGTRAQPFLRPALNVLANKRIY